MDPILIAILGVVIMLMLIAFGVPIAFSMAIIGVVGIWATLGFPQAVTQISIYAIERGRDFVFVALPLFILMGQLVYHSGIAVDMYDCVHKWCGRLPGGLAITQVAGCAGFGAVTGSSVAAIATIAPMSMPELRRYKYDMRLATGSLASAAPIAMLIPPSVILVAYGVWTETSIGHLFIAGIIPGVVLSIMFAVYIWVRCTINPAMGPVGPRYSWSERISSLRNLIPIFSVFLLVLGGIYLGIFTPSEAAGIGVSGIFAVTVFMGRARWPAIRRALIDTVAFSSMIYIIIVGGHLLGTFLVVTGVTASLIAWISVLELSRYVVMAIFVVMYLVLGAVLDIWAMLILTLPFVFPVIVALGFDPVWFGIFVVMMVEIALITPPIGINVYVMNKLAPDVDLSDIFRGVTPFVIVSLIFVALLIAFPQMALFLPELAFG